MQLKPVPWTRGTFLREQDGYWVGGIGGFSSACVGGDDLKTPLEVLLVQGSNETGFHGRVADAKHRLFEGKLESASVSFALEVFQADCGGDPLPQLQKDSNSLKIKVRGDLRDHLLNAALKEGLEGALIYLKGRSSDLTIYGHTDPDHLNDQTKTFRHYDDIHGIEGWGNFSLIDGKTPFVHVHGTVASYSKKEGGHFIMDDKTRVIVPSATVLFFPTSPIVRTTQKEDFPTWKPF